MLARWRVEFGIGIAGWFYSVMIPCTVDSSATLPHLSTLYNNYANGRLYLTHIIAIKKNPKSVFNSQSSLNVPKISDFLNMLLHCSMIIFIASASVSVLFWK